MDTPVRKGFRTDPPGGYKMVADVDRDAGFCSGDDEEDLDTDLHSPTDISEDSVDVKVKPITNLIVEKNCKRKRNDTRKFGEVIKRRLVDFHNGSEVECSPFRPWSHKAPPGYIPRGYQDEPLSLVLRDKHSVLECLAPNSSSVSGVDSRPQDVIRLRKSTCGLLPMKPEEFSNPYIGRVEELEDPTDKPRAFSVESLISNRPVSSLSTPSTSIVDDKRKALSVHSQQRNYKNMTRERRIEANARERTRVHTISAAFDTLRRAVPAYSHNQKLSKLSVLRIACSYILTLSRVAGNDYSVDSSQPTLAECVDNVSRTIQLEGKLRKKKDD